MMSLLLSLAVLTRPAVLTEAGHRWDDKGVNVSLVAADCGEVNAFYMDSLKLVVVCNELLALGPDLTRFVVDHEMGHAWMDQHSVPNSERGADELALLMSTKAEALAAAHWFEAMAKESSGDDGEHQAHKDRADSFVCVAYGLYAPEQTTSFCRMYAQSIAENWARLGL